MVHVMRWLLEKDFTLLAYIEYNLPMYTIKEDQDHFNGMFLLYYINVLNATVTSDASLVTIGG